MPALRTDSWDEVEGDVESEVLYCFFDERLGLREGLIAPRESVRQIPGVGGEGKCFEGMFLLFLAHAKSRCGIVIEFLWCERIVLKL